MTDRGFNGCVKEKPTAVKKATTSKLAATQPTTPKASSETSTTTETKLLQSQLEKQKRLKIVLS